MEELIQFLHSIDPLAPELEQRLRSIIRPINYKKNQIFHSPGEISRNIFFVKSGLIRIYHMKGDEEVSDWFIKEGDICVSVGSFFDQSPSVEFHMALEKCECWGINFEELEDTYRLRQEFNLHGRKVLTHYYAEYYKRQSFLNRQDTDVKYQHLMDKYPDFLRRIKNIHIASYLGVSIRTYGRIRSEYLKKKKAVPAKGEHSKKS